MRQTVITLAIAFVACGIACAQESANPNADQLKCYAPFIGTWRYEGPMLEELPGLVEKGTNCVIEFTWKRIMNKASLESSLRVEIEGHGMIYADKSLIGWNAADQQIVYGGTSSNGAVFLGTAEPAAEGKSLTCAARGSDSDGGEISNRSVFTVTDRNTLTFEALERTGPIVQGPSPVYTLTRVRPAKSQELAECPWEYVTGHWKHTDSTGNESEVVWKLIDGNSLIGMWKGQGEKATELVGWRPDQSALVATGYGENGEHWEVKFTTVTDSMIKGPSFQRTSDGKIMRGTFQLTKKSDDEMPTLFVGTIDGQKATVEGCFTRVK